MLESSFCFISFHYLPGPGLRPHVHYPQDAQQTAAGNKSSSTACQQSCGDARLCLLMPNPCASPFPVVPSREVEGICANLDRGDSSQHLQVLSHARWVEPAIKAGLGSLCKMLFLSLAFTNGCEEGWHCTYGGPLHCTSLCLKEQGHLHLCLAWNPRVNWGIYRIKPPNAKASPSQHVGTQRGWGEQ